MQEEPEPEGALELDTVLSQPGKTWYKSQDVLRFSIDYSHDFPCKCSHTPTQLSEGIIFINIININGMVLDI